MRKTQNMTEGPIIRTIIMFAIPLMLGNIFQTLYVMTDSIIVGRGLGSYGLSALGTVDWLVWMPTSALTGLTQGFAVRFARDYGAGDHRSLNRSVALCLELCAIISVLSVLIMGIGGRTFLQIMSTPETVFADTLQYLRIITAGLPIVCFYNYYASVLRSLGNSKDPLVAMVIASLLNVTLDYIFVIVMHKGVWSAALATVIAQAFSMVYCYVMVRKVSFLKPVKEDYRFSWKESISLLKLGLPMLAMNILISVGGMVVQTVVNRLGIVMISANTIINKLYSVFEMAAVSLGYAMTTFIAQNYGAGKVMRIRKGYREGLLAGILISAAVGIGLFVFRRQFVQMFLESSTDDYAAIMKATTYYISVISVFMPVLYILHVSRCTLQGLQNTFIPMLSSIAEFTMRLLAALCLPKLMGPYGIFYAEISAWIGAGTLLTICCMHDVYGKKLTEEMKSR